MSRLGTETAFEVLAEAKALEAQGKKIIHLEIGEPDFNTPQNIIEAGIRALQEGWHHYTPASGLINLRQTIAQHVSRSRGIAVDPAEVVVTPGAKPILFFSLLAMTQEGDEVIYPNPGFPIYESMIRYAGASAVPIQLREELDFRLDVRELLQAMTSRTRMVILNSPNNPTGSVLSEEDLRQLASILAERDVICLSDEIYSQILYEGEHRSIASLPGMKDRTIILDGFSKTYAMTGWRLGYGVMPAPLAEHITRLMINSNSCTAAFTQMAGIEALAGDQSSVSKMVATFRRRRDRIVELLNEIEGIHCRMPRGAFYVFPNVSALGQDVSHLSKLLLHEGGVATLAGTSFGRFGEGYLRLSYANSLQAIEEAIGKISDFLGRQSVL